MQDIFISIIPAVLAFIGAVWKSKSDLDKQKLIHEAKIAEIKEEAAREREKERDRFESRLKEMRAETDEEIRKADADQTRRFLDQFIDPSGMVEKIEQLAAATEKAEELQRKSEKMQSRKGWK